MFYRRKVLLALIEAFGGSLSLQVCQMLLLLFCLWRGKNYYDFFFFQGNIRGLILLEDEDRLVQLGLLEEEQDFHIKYDQAYTSQLKAKDRKVLQALVSKYDGLDDQNLIDKAKQEITLPFQGIDIQQVSALTKQTCTCGRCNTSPCLFTIGYEGLTIDAYINLLISHRIAVLVDVRKNPISRKYGFSKRRLAQAVRAVGIAYVHIPDLGIPSSLRQNLDNISSYRRLFDYYSTHILPEQTEAIGKLKELLSDFERLALTCFEADYHCCHRHRIVEYLRSDSTFVTPVIHLAKNSTFIT